MDNSIFCHLTEEKHNKRFRKMHFYSFLLFSYQKIRFNILVKPIFPNSRFSAIRNLDFTFSHTLAYGGPKVDNSIFCHLTEEKQNKRFRKMHFSSFLLFW